MLMKGFVVYMSEEEFQAISNCVDVHRTSLEGASIEFVELDEPITEASAKFMDKCIKARNK